jgi:hypothetical protein
MIHFNLAVKGFSSSWKHCPLDYLGWEEWLLFNQSNGLNIMLSPLCVAISSIVINWLGRRFHLELVRFQIWKDSYYLNLTSYRVLDMSSLVEDGKEIFWSFQRPRFGVVTWVTCGTPGPLGFGPWS